MKHESCCISAGKRHGAQLHNGGLDLLQLAAAAIPAKSLNLELFLALLLSRFPIIDASKSKWFKCAPYCSQALNTYLRHWKWKFLRLLYYSSSNLNKLETRHIGPLTAPGSKSALGKRQIFGSTCLASCSANFKYSQSRISLRYLVVSDIVFT